MVGVPHSTGCALCRERHIKVGVVELTLDIIAADSCADHSATKEFPNVLSARNTAASVRDTVAHFAFEMKGPALSGDIALRREREDGVLRRDQSRRPQPPLQLPCSSCRSIQAAQRTTQALPTWCATRQLHWCDDTLKLRSMRTYRRHWLANHSSPRNPSSS